MNPVMLFGMNSWYCMLLLWLFLCICYDDHCNTLQYRNHDALRKEHDTQIVKIAMEAGLRIGPEQWSSLLYGDQKHKSHMQSIIDKVIMWANVNMT